MKSNLQGPSLPGRRWAVALGGMLASLASPVYASQGTYDCQIGFANFSVELRAGGVCRTKLILGSAVDCTYTLLSNGQIDFSGNVPPELRAFILRYVPAGASVGSKKGPALHARNERTLDDPPPTVGWCVPRRG